MRTCQLSFVINSHREQVTILSIGFREAKRHTSHHGFIMAPKQPEELPIRESAVTEASGNAPMWLTLARREGC